MKIKQKNTTEKTKKQSKGITLIALVITIIVLLILAGVTIATLTGDNGLLTKANESQIQKEIGEEKEKIRLGYNEYKIEKYTNTNPTLKVQDATVTGNETIGWTIIFNKNNHQYTLSKDGTIEKIDENNDLAKLKRYFVGYTLFDLLDNEKSMSTGEIVFYKNERLSDASLIIPNEEFLDYLWNFDLESASSAVCITYKEHDYWLGLIPEGEEGNAKLIFVKEKPYIENNLDKKIIGKSEEYVFGGPNTIFMESYQDMELISHNQNNRTLKFSYYDYSYLVKYNEEGIITECNKFSRDIASNWGSEDEITLSSTKLNFNPIEDNPANQTLSANLEWITGNVTWSIEDASVATITSQTGNSIEVHPVANGKTKITATCGSYSASCEVRVGKIQFTVNNHIYYAKNGQSFADWALSEGEKDPYVLASFYTAEDGKEIDLTLEMHIKRCLEDENHSRWTFHEGRSLCSAYLEHDSMWEVSVDSPITDGEEYRLELVGPVR